MLDGPPPAEELPLFGVETVVAGASYPAGLAAAPDGRIFYSELYDGRIRVIGDDGTLDPVPWADVNAELDIEWAAAHHGGLSGIAFDPAFADNGYVYVVSQAPGENGVPARSLVLRYRERDGRGVEPTVILDVRAAAFDNIYSLVFGPDGMLYVPSGHCCRRPDDANPLADSLGKILRLRPDGSPPDDNPFGAAAPLVWAHGIRNAFDVAFVRGSPLLVGGDNGSIGHDEINLIMPGHDYGYPGVEGAADAEGVTPPLVDFGDETIGPTGTAWYDGDLLPALRDRLLMCQIHVPGLFALRLDPDDPGRLAAYTRVVEECTLDVAVTPDGDVYLSNREAIYRLVEG